MNSERVWRWQPRSEIDVARYRASAARRGRLCALMRKWLAAMLALLAGAMHAADLTPLQMAAEYATRVDRRLELPAEESRGYAVLVEAALQKAGVATDQAQWLLVVDRHPRVQAGLLFWRSAAGKYALAGASPVSTGRPGTFDHFETPLGVFVHTTANPDFRAEGTFNGNRIRGYGVKGMRVFDFGWQQVPKGWGDGRIIQMRLQVHATDPDALEWRLGTAQSKGCIRIPASLNLFLDHFGLLDAEYEREVRLGWRLWVLKDDREPVADAGSYLVVVDSKRDDRPEWSPSPVPPSRPAPPKPSKVQPR